ncbi:MAG: HEPN domain-containing protein [candidate division Zixibacteria bacterium]|nr:HEPN domain-containing protein [candidate division Zixibacteria bacterium]
MDTREEATRLLREAREDLDRAIRYSGLKDWVTVVHYSQLAVEKSAKALISCFEAFQWTHDPSEQLKKLVEKGILDKDFLDVASHAKEAAPWHGRSTYGGLRNGLWRSPSELCTERVAMKLLDKTKKSVNKAATFIERFFEE